MYNHSKHAGNAYDVFKHDWLLKAVEKYTPKVYFESHCGFASYNKPELWESSWVKVHKMTKCKCILCDINPDVGKTIPSELTFKNTDGFAEAHFQTLPPVVPDLFFIDPPYVGEQDWTLTVELIKRLQETDIKWIVWYPLLASMDSVFTLHPTVEMRSRMNDDMYGCGMMFGNFKKEFGEE